MNSLFKTTALAALALTLALPSSNAALTYNSDDLFLSFHQTGNTTKEYVINLGQASYFRDATVPFSLSVLGITTSAFNADMIGAFGANWKTSGDILWGVAGTTAGTAVGSDPIRLIYASQPLDGAVPSASSSQTGPSNLIIGFKNNWQTTGTPATVLNSATGNPNDSISWTGSVNNPAGPFGTGALAPLEDTLGDSLSLYRIPQTITGQQVTNEGQFVINFASADITFVPAVPEPTSAVLLCGAVGAAFGFRRMRRNSATV